MGVCVGGPDLETLGGNETVFSRRKGQGFQKKDTDRNTFVCLFHLNVEGKIFIRVMTF